jgi:hypothetical protein
LKLLKQSDIGSATWQRIKQHIEERLNTARLKNDGELDAIQTARLRGQIAELKYLADLDKPDPQMEDDAHLL